MKKLVLLLGFVLFTTLTVLAQSQETEFGSIPASDIPNKSPVKCKEKTLDLFVMKMNEVALGLWQCEPDRQNKLFFFKQESKTWEEINLNQNIPAYAGAPSSNLSLVADTEKGRLLVYVYIYKDFYKKELNKTFQIEILPNGVVKRLN